MNKPLSIIGLCLCVSLAASAVPIDITVNPVGALYSGGVANKTEYGQSGNSPADNLAFLKKEIGFWNGNSRTSILPGVSLSTANDLVVSGLSGSTYRPSTSGDYEYVVFHFGAGNAGSSGGYWEAMYLGGVNIDTLTFTLPKVGGQSVGAFSSAVFFDPVSSKVPDGGLTLALLGVSLCVIHGLRRKLGAA